MQFDLAGKSVFVAGHTGMAGSAIVRRLRQEPCTVHIANRRELDFTRQDQPERYLSAARASSFARLTGANTAAISYQ